MRNAGLNEAQAGIKTVRRNINNLRYKDHSTLMAEKQKNSRKASVLLNTLNPFTVWITTNCGKILKTWESQTTLPASWEICMQVKKQQLELDIEQQAGSK